MSPISLDKVLDLLLRYGYITESQIPDIKTSFARHRAKLTRQRQKDGLDEPSVAQVLGALSIQLPGGEELTEDSITEILARSLGMRYEKIDPLKIDSDLLGSIVSIPFARKHKVAPIRKHGDSIEVAVFDPSDREALELIGRLSGSRPIPVLASLSDIERAINEVMGFKKSVQRAAKELDVGVDLGNLEQLFRLSDISELEADDRHIVAAVDYLLHYALAERATDIHIEPQRETARIRLRIDGVLHTIYTFPRAVHLAIVNRIKTLARLDIAERRRPQDGRLKTFTDDGREVEMRVSTLSTAFGEKLVIRLFDAGDLVHSIENLGMFPEQLEIYNRLIHQQSGIVLITGPTGSGKTTTLYSTLKEIYTPQINIVTIEDPIEMVFEEFNQTAVHRRIGLDFAKALKHILRQDPDVIMVGEIRDEETAENAVQAALTGHLVFATLHTNDAVSAAIRLEELGIKRYLIASTLRGVVAQRLVRRICPYCKMKIELDERELRALDIPMPDDGSPIYAWRGDGCNACRNTGFLGRIGVFEVLEITDRLSRMIKQGSDARELLSAARQEGLIPLREAGIRLLASGTTSYEELLRILV